MSRPQNAIMCYYCRRMRTLLLEHSPTAENNTLIISSLCLSVFATEDNQGTTWCCYGIHNDGKVFEESVIIIIFWLGTSTSRKEVPTPSSDLEKGWSLH